MNYLINRKYSILSKVSKFKIVFVLAFALMMPLFFTVASDCGGSNTGGDAGGSNTTTTGTGSSQEDCTNFTVSTKINNPLRSDLNDIPSFIIALIKIILYLGVPLVALAIIYSGFLFVSAQGNKDKLKEAKGAMLGTLIGAFILLGAFVIANAIKGSVEEISNSAQ